MKQYLFTIYQPDGPPPADLDMAKIMEAVKAWEDEAKAAGVWVFSGGLHPPSSATVVEFKDGQLVTTDGPYVEGKEHVGGLDIIRAPDLDVALEWAGKLEQAFMAAPGSTGLPIEVRPLEFGDHSDA